MAAIQQEIQRHLHRLGLASTEGDYGQGGGLDIDFSYDGGSTYIKITDSQEQTVFNVFRLLEKLQTLSQATFEDFWAVTADCIVDVP
jgi:hypothetical protein